MENYPPLKKKKKKFVVKLYNKPRALEDIRYIKYEECTLIVDIRVKFIHN